jgi:hypothetical protein
MFLFYINDLPDCVSSETMVALFADDSKCIKEIKHISDCLQLQSDVDNLLLWSEKWCMRFNADKCKLLTVTRKRNPIIHHYVMNNTPIEKVESMRDLGVEISSNLSWDTHINISVTKANRMLGLVQRTCGHNCSIQTKRQLYLTLIRSILDYSSQSWAASTKKSLLHLEGVQRRATKYILGYPKEMTYEERLIKLNLLPLSYRREINDCIFLAKCRQGNYDLNLNNFVSFKVPEDTSLVISSFKTESFRHSFFNRVYYSWNNMPLHDTSTACVSFYKSQLLEYYSDLLKTKFSSANSCTWVGKCHCKSCRY